MREGSGSATIEQPFSLPALCRHFSEHSPLPTLAVEGEAHVVRYLNVAFSRLVGKERSELVGRPLADAVPEGAANGCLGLVDRVFRTGTPGNLAEQEHRAARPAYWSYIMWPIPGTDGSPAGVMIQVTEVTETAVFRKRVAEMNGALIVSAVREHELRETTERLNGRLQVAIGHRDHFMAVLSHELRTPLAPVLAAVAILGRDRRLDPDTRATLEMIERNVGLEARLIDDLLDMTRIERGEMRMERRPVDLREVIGHAAEVCRAAATAGGLALEVDLGGGPLVVDADAGRLQQVFWNLMRNSIKFSPEGASVRVRCRRLGDSRAEVEVSDRGLGIAAELLPRVFDAFQQGGIDQVRKFGGLGLGLAISKTIVDLHDGTIAARSDGKGRGATFTVELPILAGARLDFAAAGAGRSEARFPLRSLRILLVEDHADTARIMRRLLAAEGHEVRPAATLAAALELAASHPFDLLLSDLNLPDGSGLDLLRKLREQGTGLIGIAMSGYGQEQDVARSLAAGFEAHLTKPVSAEGLLATIGKVARDHGGR